MLRISPIDDYLAIEGNESLEWARSLSVGYREALPFPHIVVDNFIDADVLRRVLADFPSSQDKSFFDRDQERLKFQYSPQEVSSGLVRNLFAELNGPTFLRRRANGHRRADLRPVF